MIQSKTIECTEPKQYPCLQISSASNIVYLMLDEYCGIRLTVGKRSDDDYSCIGTELRNFSKEEKALYFRTYNGKVTLSNSYSSCE